MNSKLSRPLENAKNLKRFYCVSSSRYITKNKKMEAKYVFYSSLHLAGVLDSDALKSALRELNATEAKHDPVATSLDPEHSLRDYYVERSLGPLGTGRYGTVFPARRKSDDKPVAIKIISRIHTKQLSDFEREVKLQRQCKHPNVVSIIDHFSGDKAFYIVMERMDLDLYDYEKREIGKMRAINQVPAVIPPAEVKSILRSIAKAISHCHSVGVVLCDIKSENVLIRGREVKITDFGFARDVRNPERASFGGGTLECFAPERFKISDDPSPLGENFKVVKISQTPCDFPEDAWQLGLICYELLTGKRLFYSSNKEKMIHNILRKDLGFGAGDYPEGSEKDFLSKILDRNPKTRMTVAEALLHPFLNEV